MMRAYYVLGAVASGFLWDERIFTAKVSKIKKEHLPIVRLSMVLASLSPLFMIWAISGRTTPFSGATFEPLCLVAVILPSAYCFRSDHRLKKEGYPEGTGLKKSNMEDLFIETS